MKERRYTDRKAVRLPVRFRVLEGGYEVDKLALSSVHSGYVRDLGTNGAGIEATRRVVPSGYRLTVFMQWQLPDGTWVRTAADPVWCEPIEEGYHVGLRFVVLGDSDRKAIAKLVR